MESLFQRTVTDVIKELRLASMAESMIISKAVEEIRREIRSTDHETKAVALHKLTYLHSLHGIDMNWASFHAVEVVSSPSFSQKRLGYLAASLSFNESTDVILLLTNHLRKDLSSPNPFYSALALQFLSVASNSHLSCDLTPDLFSLLSTCNSFLRKKVLAVLPRVFATNPDSVRVCFKRVVENLEVSDPSSLSVTVSVFCQLVFRDPRPYVPLAPEFFRILVQSNTNWVLIKSIKVFAMLCPVEPRLEKKVVEPIFTHMTRTEAKSLVLECSRAMISAFKKFTPGMEFSVSKVREFMDDDDDPNLKYLGLQLLSLLAPTHLQAVIDSKELIIKSLKNTDPNIKLVSLNLLMRMVSGNNVVEISKILMNYAIKSDPDFSNEIFRSLLTTCASNFYHVVIDFDWYVSLLGEMTRMPQFRKGEQVESQLVDIGIRVKEARSKLVHVSRDLLIDPALIGNIFLHRVLSAAAWISGEYVAFSENKIELVEALVQPRTSLLPPLVRAVYIHSVFKVLVLILYSFFMEKKSVGGNYESGMDLENNRLYSPDSVVGVVSLVEESLLSAIGKGNEVEVTERAENVLGFIEVIKKEFGCFSSYEVEESAAYKVTMIMYDTLMVETSLVPLAAQAKVAVPDGLVLSSDLSAIDVVCGICEDEIPTSISFSRTCFNSGSHTQQQESKTSITEHKKQNRLYYLPPDVDETGSDCAKPIEVMGEDIVDSLFRLGEKTVENEGGLRPRLRPTVVKLEEGEGGCDENVVVPVVKEDGVSGVVRDVLVGRERRGKKGERRRKKRGDEKERMKKTVATTDVVKEVQVIPDFLL